MNEIRLLTKIPVNNDIVFGYPSDIWIKTPEVIPKHAGTAGAQRGMFAGPGLILSQWMKGK